MNKPDYTGASAQQAIDSFTNRPEDQGDLEQFQQTLSDLGVIEPTPTADLLNALLHGMQGQYKKAGTSILGMFPYLGDLFKMQDKFKKIKKVKSAYGKGKKASEFLANDDSSIASI